MFNKCGKISYAFSILRSEKVTPAGQQWRSL